MLLQSRMRQVTHKEAVNRCVSFNCNVEDEMWVEFGTKTSIGKLH